MGREQDQLLNHPRTRITRPLSCSVALARSVMIDLSAERHIE